MAAWSSGIYEYEHPNIFDTYYEKVLPYENWFSCWF